MLCPPTAPRRRTSGVDAERRRRRGAGAPARVRVVPDELEVRPAASESRLRDVCVTVEGKCERSRHESWGMEHSGPSESSVSSNWSNRIGGQNPRSHPSQEPDTGPAKVRNTARALVKAPVKSELVRAIILVENPAKARPGAGNLIKLEKSAP